MEQKKAMLRNLIATMRQKMLDGEGDEPMDPGEAIGESKGEEHKENLQEVLQTEEEEVASGEDLDDDGKAGDPELIAAIKKYMSGNTGGAGMKAGPVMGAMSATVSQRTSAPTVQSKKIGGRK